MLRFFRDIRRRLIMPDNVRKYLFYAIGEIFLVVIGILIALQINNWNELRKQNLLEIKALHEISSDFEEDILSLENDVSLNMWYVRSAEIIRNALHTNLDFHDSLTLHFGLLNFNTTFTLKNSGYENLKSLGFHIISDDDVRKSITDLYASEYSFLKESEEIAERMTYEYFSPRYLSYFKSISSQPGYRSAARHYVPKDFDAMKNDSEFQLLLDYNISIKEENLYNLGSALSILRETKLLVENYLSKLN